MHPAIYDPNSRRYQFPSDRERYFEQEGSHPRYQPQETSRIPWPSRDDRAVAYQELPPVTHEKERNLRDEERDRYNRMYQSYQRSERDRSPPSERPLAEEMRRQWVTERIQQVNFYTDLIKGYAQANHLAGAFHVWREMAARRIAPTLEIYTDLMNLCGAHQDIEGIRAIEKHVRGSQVQLDREYQEAWGCALVKCHRIEDACAILGKNSPFTKFFRICFDRANVHDAVRVFDQMNQANVDLNQNSVFKLFTMCAKQGNSYEALFVFNLMASRKVLPLASEVDTAIQRFANIDFFRAVHIQEKATEMNMRLSARTWQFLANAATKESPERKAYFLEMERKAYLGFSISKS